MGQRRLGHFTRVIRHIAGPVPEGSYATATCKVCGEHRYLTRALMLEKAGDVALEKIEPRLRCVARPQSNKRGPACGGRMTLGLDGPIRNPPEARAPSVAMAEEMAAFTARMRGG